jgi:hypothetical protein
VKRAISRAISGGIEPGDKVVQLRDKRRYQFGSLDEKNGSELPQNGSEFGESGSEFY